MDRHHPEGFLDPSPRNVRAILSRYGIPSAQATQAAHGIENLTLFVQAGDEEYVLRVYPQGKKSDAVIRLELAFMGYLRDGGLPIPAILSSPTDGPLTICELDGARWQCVLMERAPGTHPAVLTPTLLDHMATTQARMHILGERFARLHNTIHRPVILRGDVLTAGISRDALDARMHDFLARVDAYVVALDDRLPRGWSHFDYDIENILAQGDTVTAILDFSDMACMPLVVCLGYTLWDVLFEPGGSPAAAARYLQTYGTVRPQASDEVQALQHVVLFRHYIITTVRIRLGGMSDADVDVDDALRQEQVLATCPWIT